MEMNVKYSVKLFKHSWTFFLVQVQYLTLMGMELHARSRRDLEPDPEFDPICALFYCLKSDAPLPDVDSTQRTGAIVVDKDHHASDQGKGFVHSTTLTLHLLYFTVDALYLLCNHHCLFVCMFVNAPACCAQIKHISVC